MKTTLACCCADQCVCNVADSNAFWAILASAKLQISLAILFSSSFFANINSLRTQWCTLAESSGHLLKGSIIVSIYRWRRMLFRRQPLHERWAAFDRIALGLAFSTLSCLAHNTYARCIIAVHIVYFLRIFIKSTCTLIWRSHINLAGVITQENTAIAILINRYAIL